MNEKLIIKNFGPIKSVELELSRFNVLIGENTTGKSTVAKVLSSIYSLLEGTGVNPAGIIKISEIESFRHFKKHLSVYEIDKYLKPDTFIQLNGKEINFLLDKEDISFNSEDLIKLNMPKPNQVTYIPADRIATTLFSGATWADLIDIEDGKIDMPKYFLRFVSLFNRLKRLRNEYDFTEILGVKFKYDNEIDKIILNNNTAISLSESASAIQSNLSLCTIIDWQAENRGVGYYTTFIIEEPELNLFPTAQNKLVQYLVDKTINYGNSILVTTHSPYTLTSLNNMIYAFHLGETHGEETKSILDKKYWLNSKDVSVYMMLQNGACEDIFDREEGLIKAEKIDEVTNILNNQFSELLNLEFAANESNSQ